MVNSELLKKNTKKEGAYGDYGDYGMEYLTDKDAGSGPYRVEKCLSNTRRSFVRFDNYWGGWKENQFKRAVVEVIQETSTARALLEKGEVDLVDQWQPIEFYEQLKNNPKVKVYEDVDNKVYFAQMNNQKSPFDDINFRKAVLFAFDYDTAINDIFYGGQLAHGPIPSRMPGYNPETMAYSYDIAKAQEFLGKSKYKAADQKILCKYLKAGVHEQVMLLLQANLAAIGINLELKTEQWPTLAVKSARRKQRLTFSRSITRPSILQRTHLPSICIILTLTAVGRLRRGITIPRLTRSLKRPVSPPTPVSVMNYTVRLQR